MSKEKHAITLDYGEIKEALEKEKLPETSDVNRHINLGIEKSKTALLLAISEKTEQFLSNIEDE